ncbi:hypothetical protein fh0823_19180 [Francisella halioticida]|uniref:Uncharacterized protein n=1 Tax=Francisella halioticida TaxID=549298 RepID=A0ABM6M1S6_9GAMM|nr:hypothetical protein [Francisella halioticida]ASG68805.1 hypothetical protein CDV26_10810 [Francisella halioticida]BCD91779.1 hypothetical protein fh0823_19180 [Francisella halioticida]
MPGTFAKDLRDCIYKNICNSMQNKIQGSVVAGFLPLWGKNSSYNIFGKQVTSKPIDIQIPK